MEDKKKDVMDYDEEGLDERIRNTAELLAGFAKENLDKKTADEIISGLADIIKKDEV